MAEARSGLTDQRQCRLELQLPQGDVGTHLGDLREGEQKVLQETIQTLDALGDHPQDEIRIEGLTLQASANVNNSEFQSLNPTIAAATGAQDGDSLPFAPDWTFALVSSYSVALGNNWMGHVSLGYSHIAAQYGQFGTTAKGDDRDLLRGRIGATFKDFGVYVFGDNLLDENGAIYSQSPVGGLTTYTQDYPRQVGIEVTYDFN